MSYCWFFGCMGSTGIIISFGSFNIGKMVGNNKSNASSTTDESTRSSFDIDCFYFVFNHIGISSTFRCKRFFINKVSSSYFRNIEIMIIRSKICSICLPMRRQNWIDTLYLSCLLCGGLFCLFAVIGCYVHIYFTLAKDSSNCTTRSGDASVANKMAILVCISFRYIFNF